MESGLLTTPDFNTFSKKVVPFLHVTTRLEGRAYEGLLGEKGGTGFPTLMFLDEEGGVLGLPAGRSAEAFDAKLGSLNEVLQKIADMKAKIAKGEKGLEKELFFLELDLGRFDLKALQAKAKSLKGLTDAQQERLAADILDLQMKEVFNFMRQEDGLAKAGKILVEIHATGVFPTGRNEGPFWGYSMEYAESVKNVELFEAALNEIERMFGDNERMAPLLAEKKAALDKMKNGDEPEEEVVEGQ